MDQNTFKTQLALDGYSRIETNDLEPKPSNAEHAHDHDIRGLVLDGVFMVWTDNRPVSYHSGEVFEVAAGIKHAEQVGSNGARVVIGRRWPTEKV